ncbi:hypothetical protein [Magnetococcus marinus]|uniref:hypothetical protein n=1 Tax=Magnetococcus marinus TaxID=1124597 RepID=UPI00117C456C|nr:hypothetical protein [Magnetococcus marinus]
MSQDDIDALRMLAERYVQIKVFIAYAEEIQVDHKADILVYKELRDGMDHLMRVLYHRLSAQSADIEDLDGYRDINIGKSIGHLYRAAFDALDATILSLREHISANLSGYTMETVSDVIPNYYMLKIKLNQLTKQAADRRGKKDIGRITDDTFDQYVQDVDELKKLHESVLYAGQELCEHKKSLKIKKWKDIIWSLFLVIFGVIFGIAVKAGYDYLQPTHVESTKQAVQESNFSSKIE